ncbi:MAG: ABC transporter permease [Oscillospiraceae bacterium]|nr:ABC transporter permease [Oscillospiraceae bacterium]
MSDQSQGSPGTLQPEAKQRQSFLVLLIRKRTLMMLFLFVIIIAVFAIRTDGRMIDMRNIMQILNMMAVSTFLTQGVALLMISGKLDLSTGANGTLCGMFLAYVLRAGVPLIPAILMALAVGALVGVVNAALVNELNMAPFIATLATSLIATGFVILIAQNRIIPIRHPVLIDYGSYMLFRFNVGEFSFPGVPVSAFLAFCFMAIIGVLLHKTKFGRQTYLVGGNPQAAMLSGINPKKMSYILFIICGLFSSIAGITLVSRLQSANMQGLVAQRFQGITAAVLGGISLGGGTGGMAGAFVGLLVLNTFSNGMTVQGTGPGWQHIASGGLLIFALTLEYFQRRQNEKIVA